MKTKAQILLLTIFALTHMAQAEIQNIALNKPYTFSSRLSLNAQGYPPCTEEGDIRQLTDGRLAPANTRERHPLAVMPRTPNNIVIDLEKASYIQKIRVHSLTIEENTSRYPQSITVLVSDNEDGPFYLVGEYKNSFGIRDPLQPLWGTTHNWFEFETEILGRFATIILENQALGACIVDEIEVIGTESQGNEVDMSLLQSYPSPDIRPFYWRDTTEICSEIPLPMFFKRTRRDIPLEITLPSEVDLIAPHSSLLTENENATKTYAALLTRDAYPDPIHLILTSNQPQGWQGEMYIADPCTNSSQLIQLAAISIPETPALDGYYFANGWTNWNVYHNWPDFFHFYKHTGFNTFGTPKPLRAIQHDNDEHPDNKTMAFLDQAQANELYIASHFTPMCDFGQYLQIEGIEAAETFSGNTTRFASPLSYLEAAYELVPEVIYPNDVNRFSNLIAQEIYDARSLIRHGIRWIWFDTESNFYPNIDYSPAAKDDFARYMTEHYPDMEYIDPSIVAANSEDYPEHWPAWLEYRASVGTRLFGLFRNIFENEMEHQERSLVNESFRSPAGSDNILLGEYHAYAARQANGRAWKDSVFYDFRNMFEAGVMQQSMPVFYSSRAAEVIETINTERRYLAPFRERGEPALIIPWVSPHLNRRSSDTTTNSLFEEVMLCTLFSGADGATIFYIYGMEARDYGTWADCLRTFQPYAEFAKTAEPIQDCFAQILTGQGVVGGLQSPDNSQIILLAAPTDAYHASEMSIRLDIDLSGYEITTIKGPEPELIMNENLIELGFNASDMYSIIVLESN